MTLGGHRLDAAVAAGFVIVTTILLLSVFAGWVAPYGEAAIVGGVWAPPSREHWLGLDHLGRDLASRLLYGGRVSIGLALLITTLACILGVLGGVSAAVAPRWVDMALSRVVDALMSIPQLILALIVLSAFGTSLLVLVGTIAMIESTRFFRLSRVVAMNIVVLEYVEVARQRGEGLWWVLRREVLPNALPPLIAEFGLRFCFTLLFIASLSFLGLGVQPPTADWGGMVRENALAINFGGWAVLAPAAALALLTIGVNLVVDWFLSMHNRSHGDRA